MNINKTQFKFYTFPLKKILFLRFVLLLIVVYCANIPYKFSKITNQKNSDIFVTNAAAAEMEVHNFVEIEFKPGSASLTDSAKSALSALLKNKPQDNKIGELIVLSWSDDEYPSKNLKELPKQQQELAKKRNNAVKKYVQSLRVIDVDSYNMAEKPSAFAKLFNTSDSKLKNSLVSAGLSTTATSSEYVHKASRSVILLK